MLTDQENKPVPQMIKHKNAKSLVNKYLKGKVSPEESRLLEKWFLNDLKNSKALPDKKRIEEADQRISAHLMNHIGGGFKPEVKVRRMWPRIAAAASVILCLSYGAFFFLHKSAAERLLAQNQVNDIAPGGNKAILTLSSGRIINLTSGQDGTIATDGDETINKKKNDTISYRNTATGNYKELVYNTITTPRGGQWPVIILPDGSKAILDAASSIKFPVNFIGNDRRVAITGQVYFEVVHNAAKPFKVDVKGQTIEDIGTHFNINAYDDEPSVKTTLLEGGIKITKGSTVAIIKPGQQATTTMGDNTIKVDNANMEEAIAWKNGLFMFKGADMQTVMRQLSRWYNVDIVYEGAVPRRTFNGDMHRNLKASQVLDVLSFYNVQFKIDGKKIIVNE